MFYDQKPPVSPYDKPFPSFSTTVTVPNCWYYLSLLERFVDATKDMPEDVLKLYLVRAEYRYFKWFNLSSGKGAKPRYAPPLDVAFFWQAHALSPIRYYEDRKRFSVYTYIDKIPLQKIHEARTADPDNRDIIEWNRLMEDEPYDLAEDLSSGKDQGYALVTCIVCLNPIKSPWKEYAIWRTDHSTALQCGCCKAMFTVKHVGKANMLSDNVKKQHTTAGLLTSARGDFIEARKEHELLLPLKEVKELPFNQGLKPLDDLIKSRPRYKYNAKPEDRERIIDAIQSTYLCTPYRASSIDLIQAVARQYKFAFKVTKTVNWRAPIGIVNGIKKYADFLAVIKDNPNLTAVPTIEIDLAWHTHMLHPFEYRTFCMNYIYKIINHDDTIPEKQLEHYVDDTDKAWKRRNDKRKEAEEELRNWTPPQPIKPEPVPEAVKPTGLKGKIKSILKIKKKAKAAQPSPASYISPQSAVPPKPKNGYRDNNELFSGSFREGAYEEEDEENLPATVEGDTDGEGEKDLPAINDSKEDEKENLPLRADIDVISSEEVHNEKAVEDLEITSELPSLEKDVPEDGKAKALEENDTDKVKLDKNEIVYDKENVSYHDKRDIKEFIKLNNDDDLMDSAFIRVKRSHYGFIGTSTCANTDFLDQWTPGKDTEPVDEKGNPLISHYTKVFMTKAGNPVFSAKGLVKINEIEKSQNIHKLRPHYTNQKQQFNTAGADFNWYYITSTWNECILPFGNRCTECGGGWTGYSDDYTTTTNCAGISTSGDSTKVSGCGSSSHGHSSCGSSSSSCGGGSSSCGSSCGGGGCGGGGGGGD